MEPTARHTARVANAREDGGIAYAANALRLIARIDEVLGAPEPYRPSATPRRLRVRAAR